MLTRIPGIGKKTAERLLLELKDKFSINGVNGVGIAQPKSATSDILNALLALGYNDKEALATIKLLPKDLSVSEGIRQSLKLLSK